MHQTVRLSSRIGGFAPGRKFLTLFHARVAGASHIDHADMLRPGPTDCVLGTGILSEWASTNVASSALTRRRGHSPRRPWRISGS